MLEKTTEPQMLICGATGLLLFWAHVLKKHYCQDLLTLEDESRMFL
jgi:hypothetical protein